MGGFGSRIFRRYRLVLALRVLTFVLIALGVGVALYVLLVARPLVVSRREFLRDVTSRGGYFVALCGQENAFTLSDHDEVWARWLAYRDGRRCDEYVNSWLRFLSEESLKGEWNLSRDWALWRMTAVTINFPEGTQPGEDWVIQGLKQMPHLIWIRFSGTRVTVKDSSLLVSNVSSLSTLRFSKCTFASRSVEPLLQLENATVEFDECQFGLDAIQEGLPRNEIRGLWAGTMTLDEKVWLSLFRRVSCRYLVLIGCDGISAEAWDEMLSMPSLERVELKFNQQRTLETLLNATATNKSVKHLSVYLPHDYDADQGIVRCSAEVLKALPARFPSVTNLRLIMLRISDESLQYVSNWKGLKELEIYVSEVIGSMRPLEDCQTLQSVKIYAGRIGGEATLDVLKARGVKVSCEKAGLPTRP